MQMTDRNQHRDPATDGAAPTLGWRLDVKAAAAVAVALLLVVLLLSFADYGSDGVRPGGEVAPVTETDADRVPGVEVGAR